MALDGTHVAGTGDHVGDHNLIDAQLALKVNFVLVSTGTEARPAGAGFVLWIETRTGTPSEPTNMGTNDRWLT